MWGMTLFDVLIQQQVCTADYNTISYRILFNSPLLSQSRMEWPLPLLFKPRILLIMFNYSQTLHILHHTKYQSRSMIIM